ncbi:hypothetical protein NL676_010859 [Syzygium grande]|nr:hypothetical protein NL676_010859 [Syzygium grande]
MQSHIRNHGHDPHRIAPLAGNRATTPVGIARRPGISAVNPAGIAFRPPLAELRLRSPTKPTPWSWNLSRPRNNGSDSNLFKERSSITCAERGGRQGGR